MAALVLASECLRKFGGDSLQEFVRNHDTFITQVREQTAHIDTDSALDPEATPLNWDAGQAFADGADAPKS
jgi:hypothetical protein